MVGFPVKQASKVASSHVSLWKVEAGEPRVVTEARCPCVRIRHQGSPSMVLLGERWEERAEGRVWGVEEEILIYLP